jgi:hypothetical protein
MRQQKNISSARAGPDGSRGPATRERGDALFLRAAQRGLESCALAQRFSAHR